MEGVWQECSGQVATSEEGDSAGLGLVQAHHQARRGCSYCEGRGQWVEIPR